jgi:hypothetical protein
MNINAFLATFGGRAILTALKGAIVEAESVPGNTTVLLHPTGEGLPPLKPSPNSRYPDGHIDSLDKH